VNIKFKIKGSKGTIETFTTRHDTMYGMTFLVIAPEHPKVIEWTKGTKYEKPVREFLEKVKKLTQTERTTAEKKEKRGVFLGKYAIHPFTGKEIPIYAADFVIMDFGTGIVQAVPAHDQRDFDFAKEHKLPIIVSVQPEGEKIDAGTMEKAYEGFGTLVNSGKFSGMNSEGAMKAIADKLEKIGAGKRSVAYKIRDWGISRQRYWGTPIPIVYCDKCGMVPVPEKELPVLLPEYAEFTGKGNPLANTPSFVNAKCPKCGGKARRETDTMDTFMDSNWYFLRFCSPHEKDAPFDKKAVKYWMPVDQYIGGAEHAVMHLLYARFFIKVLRDLGLLGFGEPFTRLFNQGIVYKDGHKMSKSFGNVVTQEEITERYGIDTARMFLLFVASPDSQLEWNDEGVIGAFRLLNRANSLAGSSGSGRGSLNNSDRQITSRMHKAIKSVTESMDGLKFNLAIGSLMSFMNDLYRYREDPNRKVLDDAIEAFLIMLSPFAPHTAEELWERTGHKGFVSVQKWPEADESLIDPGLEIMDVLLEQTREDIRNVLKLVGRKPGKIRVYVSPVWKHEVYKEILCMAKNPERIVPEIMKGPHGKKYGSHALKFAQSLAKNAMALRRILTQDEEFSALSENAKALEREFDCRVEILKADTERSDKALRAEPGKPGIEVI
jgi:leucyl-tRNA synthetase